MKLMMGRGVSRNVAREFTKIFRGLKEVENLQKHYSKIGEKEQEALVSREYWGMTFRICELMRVASKMEQRYRRTEEMSKLHYIRF